MKSHQNTGSGCRHGNLLKAAAGMMAACSLMLASPLMAAEVSFSGESNTIFRMKTTIDKKDIFPAYEYLRLSLISAEKDGSALSLHIGGWARGDLGDKSARDRYTDADLQYGYLSYRGAKNNLLLNAGRQFVVEGVATERLDGLYVRNDFAAGFAAAAFVGSPVITEPNSKGDTLIFGGRISQSMNKYYSVGISALKSFAHTSRYREEEGIDLWLHPVKQVDITGRSSYNSITGGWMEHAYTASFTPIENLRLFADLSGINYRDYFYKVTTNALVFSRQINGIDPNDKVLTLGGGGSYTVLKNLTFAADYKHYDYDIAQAANYYGGKVSYAIPDSFAAGLSIHRMDGKADKLKYTEYRLYASKKIGHADLVIDAVNLNYDTRIHGVRNSYAITGGAGYEFNEKFKIAADMEYSKSPDFDNEVRGLIKLTYAFDTKRGEGRAKSEK